MRLIDADILDFSKVFIGNSKIAKDCRCGAQAYIDIQPRVDAVVHGHWITHNPDNPFTIYGECSECGFKPDSMRDKFNYCPNCGAKMDGCSNEET